jgi:hypothetical protein
MSWRKIIIQSIFKLHTTFFCAAAELCTVENSELQQTVYYAGVPSFSHRIHSGMHIQSINISQKNDVVFIESHQLSSKKILLDGRGHILVSGQTLLKPVSGIFSMIGYLSFYDLLKSLGTSQHNNSYKDFFQYWTVSYSCFASYN